MILFADPVSRVLRPLLLCGFAAALVPLAVGCGGGVATDTTVKIKRETSESAAPGKDTAGGAPKEGAPASGFGTLKGRVVLKGDAPSPKLIIAAGANVRDKETCAAVDLPNERLVLGPGNGVANVFLYLPKAPAGAKESPVPMEEAIFDQKGCKFIPHALLVRVGQTVLIKSDDPILHNTHSYAQKTPIPNATIKPNDRKGTAIVYKRPENDPVEVKCDFHTWMIAYHLPVEHPFAAVTAPDGSFEIKDLPAGEHKFKVWHEACDGGYLSRSYSVTIKANEETAVEIPYPKDKLKL